MHATVLFLELPPELLAVAGVTVKPLTPKAACSLPALTANLLTKELVDQAFRFRVKFKHHVTVNENSSTCTTVDTIQL